MEASEPWGNPMATSMLAPQVVHREAWRQEVDTVPDTQVVQPGKAAVEQAPLEPEQLLKPPAPPGVLGHREPVPGPEPEQHVFPPSAASCEP